MGVDVDLEHRNKCLDLGGSDGVLSLSLAMDTWSLDTRCDGCRLVE